MAFFEKERDRAQPLAEHPEITGGALELREIVKSESPLASKIEGSKEISIVRSWGDYTIIAFKGDKGLQIYNDRAEVVADFNAKVGSLEVAGIDNAMKVAAGSAVYFSSQPSNSHEDYYIGKVADPFMRKLFVQRFKQLSPDSTYLRQTSLKNARTVLSPSDNFQILDNGKYILIGDAKNKTFLAYNTQNDQGITLAPQDWHRIEFGSSIPPDLSKYIEQALERQENLRPLNDSFYAYITDIGINIIPADNLNAPPLFKDNLVGVKDNIAVNPQNTNVIYYCAAATPKSLHKVEMSGDSSTWKLQTAIFEKSYSEIHNLQMDPTGNFLLFYSNNDLILVAKETLQEVKRLPGYSNVNFDAQGRIRAINNTGHLVILEMDADVFMQELSKERIAKLAQGIDIADIFASAAKKQGGAPEEITKELLPIRQEWEQKLQVQLDSVTNLEQAQNFKQGLVRLRQTLAQQGLQAAQIEFITEGITEKIVEKERSMAGGEISHTLTLAEEKLKGSLSLSMISEIKDDLEELKPLELLMDEPAKTRYHAIVKSFNQQSADLFRREGDKILEEIHGLVQGVKTQLEEMTSKSEFDDWVEFRFPQLKSRLGGVAKDCPIEADTAYKGIIAARGQLQVLADQYKEKFEKEYAEVREVAAERMDALAENLRGDVGDLVSRLRAKGFKSREDAETYLGSSPAKKVIEEEITALAGQNPDIAKELGRTLKVQLSNTISEIERGGLSKVAETGQQMIVFGKTEFPRWEAKIKKEKERSVDIIFQPDSKTQGPGLTSRQILGDVELVVTDTHGKKDTVRLYEDWDGEHEWRFGLLSYRGEEIPPSYLSGEDFRTVRKQYAEWQSGKLQNAYQARKRKLFDFYKTRQEIDKRDQQDESWKAQYKELVTEFGTFCAENHVALFRRIDQVRKQEEVGENGKGFVPSWQSHWVVDDDAERNLERMAQLFKMQLDLHEGVLNLKGHAGTGKDVLIKMFCNRVNRPYFATDCTKWTTEYELGEDVVLEAKDGGTQTVKVPSTVLNGIQTPGAVVYFNEVNGMPEQAQIFLHALWDEKRSLTLKTSSGKVIKADPSVLLASSMNPNYPGTFNPQFATRSRMMSLEISYPALKRAKDSTDPNQNPPYNASEPLRIAREVKSLSDLTFEPNMTRNEFVNLWDSYVNGLKNGAPKPTAVQEFDLSVILALVEFGEKLRQDFITNFEKTRDSRNALPVKQPLTAREFRRCAYALGQIPDTEKIGSDPDNTARELLEQYFLSNIDSNEDKDKISKAMRTWRSQKRVAA